jgi:hypothetical protein
MRVQTGSDRRAIARANPRAIRRRRSAYLACGLALSVTLAACGSSSKTSTPNSDGSSTTQQTVSITTGPKNTTPESTDVGQGVTATSVKLGVVLVDYKAIAQFIDFARGDQQKIYQAFVDDINNNGGVAGGRKLDVTYNTYFPAGTAGPLTACTKFTEDTKVFATIGVLIDDSGSGQLCFTKQHHSILLTHELSEDEMSKADPGLLLTSDALAERSIRTMLDLADNKGIIKGKKFAVLAETGTKSRIKSAIEPEMKRLGIKYGTSGVLNIDPSGDTTAAQGQMASLIERWKGENDTAVFMSGLATVSKVFVQKIKAAMPGVLLMTDGDSSAKGAGQDAQHAGIKPNPYEGMLSLAGLSDEQQFETPKVQACVKVWEKASGTKVVAPKDLQPDKDGKRQEIWITVRDACADLQMFKTIADKVGKNLNNVNWQRTVDNFGPIELVGTAAASLGTGKYDADNNFSLVEFDPTAGVGGDWKSLTPLHDVTQSGG